MMRMLGFEEIIRGVDSLGSSKLFKNNILTRIIKKNAKEPDTNSPTLVYLDLVFNVLF